VKTDADPSARFADWVNAGLLRMPAANIRKVTITSYTVNPLTGGIEPGENTVLTQEAGHWKSSNPTVKEDAAKSLAATLDGLKIVDARPKPAEMARDLRAGQLQLSMQTALALRQFGFLLTQTGRILATEGEMSVEMANGVAYQIRFGDVAATASDAAKSAGGDRYLFITTGWDAARAARYGDSSGAGEKASKDLNARFADWFYVISNSDFQKFRLSKAQAPR
jgi:hypothetical protein